MELSATSSHEAPPRYGRGPRVSTVCIFSGVWRIPMRGKLSQDTTFPHYRSGVQSAWRGLDPGSCGKEWGAWEGWSAQLPARWEAHSAGGRKVRAGMQEWTKNWQWGARWSAVDPGGKRVGDGARADVGWEAKRSRPEGGVEEGGEGGARARSRAAARSLRRKIAKPTRLGGRIGRASPGREGDARHPPWDQEARTPSRANGSVF
jgi:hypothetical protein